MRMIRDCNRRKIDLILTKSVARFARNTVDSLKYVRQLKALGVGVFFEEQNLDSLKADSEMFIGLHSVLAQAESENISANVRWGIRQRMKTGTYKFRYNILGYKKGEDGQPEIVSEEAEYIKKIYAMYLDGSSLDQIKKELESKGVKTAQGKSVWSKTQIKNILGNERYSGDMLLQKTYTENCLTKKVRKNRGELAKYLITDNHPAIIERGIFKAAQMETARRGSKNKTSDKAITFRGKYSGKYALTDLLVCGECGSPYRRKTWITAGKKRYVWRCFSRMEHGTEYCKHSISVEEGMLHQAICRGLTEAIEDKEGVRELILSNVAYGIRGDEEALNAYAIENEIGILDRELEETVKLSGESGGDIKRYAEMIGKISKRIVALREQLELVKAKQATDEASEKETERVMDIFKKQEIAFHEYDDVTVRLLIEYIRVMPDGQIEIKLKGGVRIEEKIKKR